MMFQQVFILAALLATVYSMTDIVPIWCTPVCQDFIALRSQCENEANCYEGGFNDNTISCLEPCWDVAAPCLGACSDNIYTIFDLCDPQCSNSGNLDCSMQCFEREFQAFKPSLPQ